MVLVCNRQPGILRRASIFAKIAPRESAADLAGFVAEVIAALTILLIWCGYVSNLRLSFSHRHVRRVKILFYLLVQKGGPLSTVAMILRRRRDNQGHL